MERETRGTRETKRDVLGMDSQKGIQCPVSRYLIAMGSRPEFLKVNRTASVTHRKATELDGPGSRNYDTHRGNCGCEACEAELRSLGTTGTASTGKWSCGCSIYGLGSVKVGVSDSVTQELVNPCKRHEQALSAQQRCEVSHDGGLNWQEA